MRDRGRTLMVQGTTSDAGKSTLVTARAAGWPGAASRWCRSPQNMALNSAVTADGGEIGRAQAVQAQACRLAPHTDMNPVLLAEHRHRRPGDHPWPRGDQHGRRRLPRLQARGDGSGAGFPWAARRRLPGGDGGGRRLAGGDQPARQRHRQHGLRRSGGLSGDPGRRYRPRRVFAHLVGTLELLSDSERERVKGFVINRFRGDIALLQPGLDWLEARTGKPVLGVLPYVSDLHLEAEDAIDTRQAAKVGPRLKVVVPVLPRISNHTDFDPLRLHPQVELSFVGPGQRCRRRT